MPRTRGDVRERLLRAGLELLVAEGPRFVKSSVIAERAGTSESAIYRYYDDVPGLLREVYDDCWRRINEFLFQASSVDPAFGSPEDVIVKEFSHLWELKSRPDFSDILLVAMTYYRRPQALSTSASPEQQRLFQDRVTALCRGLLDRQGGEVAPEALQELLTNFAATVLLTWAMMPSGEAELTANEANIGVRSLLAGFASTDIAKQLGKQLPAAL